MPVDEVFVYIHVALLAIYSVLACLGIIFALVCLAINMYFRDKK